MFDLRAKWLQDTDVMYMKLLEQHLEEGYTCLRGPRPSGALLLLSTPVEIQTDVDDYDIVQYILGSVIPPNGSPSCKECGECMIVDGHCVRNIHAEVNALLNAALLGVLTNSATMYSWNKPCYNCTIACIQAGVRRIVYKYAVYDEERTKQAIANAGIICEEWK